MRKAILLSFATVLCSTIYSQDVWTLDASHSRIGFKVTHHMISEIHGNFKTFEATMTTAEEDYSDAVFEFSAQVESINTENERRDNHLRSEDIFDAAKFPTVNFKSNSMVQVAGEHYRVTGDLTMKGKTLPLTLDLWLVGPVTNDRGKRFELGVKAGGHLNRKEFGVGENLPTMSVSDQIDLILTGELNKAF